MWLKMLLLSSINNKLSFNNCNIELMMIFVFIINRTKRENVCVYVAFVWRLENLIEILSLNRVAFCVPSIHGNIL